MNGNKKHRTKIFMHMAAAVVLALVFQGINATPASAGEALENIGWVTAKQGSIRVIRGKEAGKEIYVGSKVYRKDIIETGKDSQATIHLDDDSLITIGSESRIEISDFVFHASQKQNRSSFRVFSGMVRGVLQDLFSGGSEMRFAGTTAVTGVKGSEIAVWIEDDELHSAVTRGKGYIIHSDPIFAELVEIEAGMMARASRGEKISSPVAITGEVNERIKRLLVERSEALIKELRGKRKEQRQRFLDNMEQMRRRHFK